MNYYAGIGSRKTPHKILTIMMRIAQILSPAWVLRSGGADGADRAFENGAAKSEIFLPWRGFNGNPSPLYVVPDIAYEIAAKYHPAWDKCTHGARALHARNSCQVLGPIPGQSEPSKVIICWHMGSGGTMQAVRIAQANKIPIWNLYESESVPERIFSEDEFKAMVIAIHEEQRRR